MNLKDFLSNREHPPELFWALVIEEGWIQAGIWYIGESKAEVVTIGPGAAWGTDDELTGAVDAALSSAVQKLPEASNEPSKTVFGVPSSWVKEGEIADEYLGKIKNICTELSLNPVGFVVLSEAIAHLCKAEEGSPLNAIVLGLSPDKLEISVFKLGSLTGNTEVSRSVSIVEDVTEGLSRFEGANPLPSRFIIYNGKEGELEEAKEALLQTSWEGIEKIKFLHTPKTETLTPERKVLATCLAGAAEMGDVSQIESKEVHTPEEIPKEEGQKEEESVTAENLGFAIGQDVSQKEEKTAKVEAPEIAEPKVPAEPKINPAKKMGAYLQKSMNFFKPLLLKEKIFPKIRKNNWTNTMTIIIFALIAAILSWWFLPKANVVVFVSPKRFEQQTKLSFTTSESDKDIDKGIISAQLITDSISGSKTKSASGSKLIGNKAVGSVVIANGNGTPINLAEGTVITASTGLKFVTNQEASVSGQILPGSPGTAKVAVTAGDIGAQYNVAKGEVFSIGNYSKAMVAGTSEEDFSGGSSQEISAVSAEDQTNLEKDLKEELTQNLTNNINSKVESDKIFVNDLANVEITNETFDHKVGDQADGVKLDLSLSATGIAADKEGLIEYAKTVLKDQVPSGFSLNNDQIDFKFEFSGVDNENYIYDVIIGANFLPQIDNQKVIKQILGKTPTVTENYLSLIPGFGHAEITLKPSLPGPLGTLPRIPKNITLGIRAEQ